MILRGLMATCLALLLVVSAQAQHAQFSIDADTVRVGQPFEAVLIAVYPMHLDLKVPTSTVDEPAMIGDFELRRLKDRSRHATAEGSVHDTLHFEAVTFALDTARVAGTTIYLEGPSDTLTVAVEGDWTPVASTYREGEEPRDLAPIVGFPTPLWPWILAAAIAAGILALLIRLSRRRPPAVQDESAHPYESPLEEALRRLQALAEHATQSTPDQKAYAIELVDLLRTYLYRRMDMASFERTTSEILRDLRQSALKSTDLDAVRHILTVSDRIKFAGAEASAALLEETRRTSRGWIEDAERTLQHVTSDESKASSAAL